MVILFDFHTTTACRAMTVVFTTISTTDPSGFTKHTLERSRSLPELPMRTAPRRTCFMK